MKKLGFGLMRLPLTQENNPQSIDQDAVNRMVDYFLSKGFTYFDTAYPYHQGTSEAAVKKALTDRYPRESFVLADKMPVWLVTQNSDYQKFFDEQLQRCGVEYFDYYLLHTMGEENYASTLKYGGFDFMKKLKAEGRAKKIGLSFHDKADVLDRILTEHPEMEFVQLQINYLDWNNDSIESRKCLEVAVKHKKPVIVMEPVKGGALADIPQEAEQLFRQYHPERSVASWAVHFAASIESVIVVLSGMSNFEQLADNVSFMESFTPMSEEENRIVSQARDIIGASIAIPCTACQYCVDDCPKKIPIPKYFSLYNDQHQYGYSPLHENYYGNLIQTYGKASDCIGCKRCEHHCPQHIEIAETLKDVSAVFDAE